jgi:hypothetical protein
MGQEDLTALHDRNVVAVTAWVEAYNAGDFRSLGALVTDEFRMLDPATGTDISGRDAFEDVGRQVVQAYPDRRIRIIGLLALGQNAVALQGEWEGTAAYDLPSGVRGGEARRRDESMVVELVDGKVAAIRVYR